MTIAMSGNDSIYALVGGDEARQRHVGHIYDIDYQTAKVMTCDAWKHRVGGIPAGSFLVAAPFDPEHYDSVTDLDREVIILRAMSPTMLPGEMQARATVVEHHRRRTKEDLFPQDSNHGMDGMTKSMIQYGAMDCKVLGTFYLDENGDLVFGSDVENIMSFSRMTVFSPTGEALETIVNHINPSVRRKMAEDAKKSGFTKIPPSVRIGSVRYSSTTRLRRDVLDVPVMINPSDFLSRRTAIFGMTRTGKSNTVKTIVSEIAMAARRDDVHIGQIIFDLNGEYANANHQDDGSSIAEVFGDDCIRYRSIETPGFEDLRINFYEECESALRLIGDLLREDKTLPQDVSNFIESSLVEPDREAHAEHNRWEIRKALFQAILYRAGFQSNAEIMVSFRANQDLKDLIVMAGGPEWQDGPGGRMTMTVEQAVQWFTIESVRDDILKWLRNDPAAEAAFCILTSRNSKGNQHRGYRIFVNLTGYHSPRRQTDVMKRIYGHLANGKIVIVDLSVGPVGIRTTLAERIAHHIFNTSMGTMTSNEVPPSIVVYTEESHNLIGKHDELTSTWPRIAKEGAKAKIAFVYATQEPGSIHSNIMANTENWIVTHLNNDHELAVLADYYDFEDFTESLKRGAQDVGFARVRTLSLAYIVPTQIRKFEPRPLIEELQKISKANISVERKTALAGFSGIAKPVRSLGGLSRPNSNDEFGGL